MIDMLITVSLLLSTIFLVVFMFCKTSEAWAWTNVLLSVVFALLALGIVITEKL